MMDVSMIDPSLLPDDTAGQMNGHDADDAEHDSEMDAEGEEEDIDMDAEGEWEEPEVDQDVYAPDQTGQPPTIIIDDDDNAAIPDPHSLAASSSAGYQFAIPAESTPGTSSRRRSRPVRSESRTSVNGTHYSTSGLISNNATPGPSRLNDSAHPRPARTHSTPVPKSKSQPTRPLQSSHSTSAVGSTKGKAKVKAPSQKYKMDPGIQCSFCGHTNEENKQGVPEVMVRCIKCGRAGHPSCLDMDAKLAAAVKTYPWTCLECKVCETCDSKGDDSRLLFCDGCDKGYHSYCLNPPKANLPKGSWHCQPCKLARIQEKNGIHPIAPDFPAPPSSSHLSKGKSKGKGRAVLPDHDFDTSQHPAIKIKPRRGRPPKHAIQDDDGIFDDWDDARSVSSTPRTAVKKRRREDTADDDDESYTASPGPRLTVRLTVGGAGTTGRGRGRGRGRPTGSGLGRGRGRGRGRGGSAMVYDMTGLEDEAEEADETMIVEEEEEEQIPYGGIITGADADTSKTSITDADKAAFEKSAKASEARLGGPRVQNTFDPLGVMTPPTEKTKKRKVDDEEYGATLQTPAPKIARGRSLRDRLLDRSLGISASTPDLSPVPTDGHAGAGAGAMATPTRSSAGANGSYFSLGPDGASATSTPTFTGTGAASATLGLPTTIPGASAKINQIRFGGMDIDTWYSAPYPEEYQYVPDGRLWLCEFCLRYMHSGFQAGRHKLKCKARHPPGDEIYREGEVSVFEVDGRKNKIYCQQLCLLAKMFLESKTLYYDVEPFLFYVMTQVDDMGARFVGYFSKEKRSPVNNVSCIMTLPVRQRKGWGQLLIDFSYLLSKKEDRVGSPEKPLSGLGEVTYKTYWKLTVFRYLYNAVGEVTIDDISKSTSMTLADTFATLKEQDLIRLYTPSPPPVVLPIAYRNRPSGRGRGRGRGRGGAAAARRLAAATEEVSDSSEESKIPEKGTYRIIFDRDYLGAVLKQDEAKGKLKLRPERLKYHPFLVTRAVQEAKEKEAALAARMAEDEAEAEGAEGNGETAKVEDEQGAGAVAPKSSEAQQHSSGVSGVVEERGDGDVDMTDTAPAAPVGVLAGQGDTALLENVEALAGHDPSPHAQPANGSQIGIGTPRKPKSNGHGPEHSPDGSTTAEVAHGNDTETLQLVAELSAPNTPKRSMRRREGTAGSASGPGSGRKDGRRGGLADEGSPLKGR